MLKYKDIFNINRGILEYSTFSFENISKTDLNILCLATFGGFILSPIVTILVTDNSISEENLQKLGEIIDYKFAENWRKYSDSLSKTYDSLDNYSIMEIETINGTTNISDETNTQENRDTFAFNSVDSVNDSKNDSTIASNKENTISNRREKTTKGFNGGILPQKIISAELEFRRKSLIDYILRDLKQFATLAVYV